jgi:hypothetical protein
MGIRAENLRKEYPGLTDEEMARTYAPTPAFTWWSCMTIRWAP